MNKGDILEQCCRAYWNEYRNGFLSIGGDKSYPTWDEFTEQRAKDETRRCMRHALEVLKALPDGAFSDDLEKDTVKRLKMERGSFDKVMARVLSDKPLRRKRSERLQAEITAEALNKGLTP
jgi:hypothetical protein